MDSINTATLQFTSRCSASGTLLGPNPEELQAIKGPAAVWWTRRLEEGHSEAPCEHSLVVVPSAIGVFVGKVAGELRETNLLDAHITVSSWRSQQHVFHIRERKLIRIPRNGAFALGWRSGWRDNLQNELRAALSLMTALRRRKLWTLYHQLVLFAVFDETEGYRIHTVGLLIQPELSYEKEIYRRWMLGMQ